MSKGITRRSIRVEDDPWLPAQAVEAARPFVTSFMERRGVTLRGKEAGALIGYVLEATAPHMLAEAWDEGHGDGFWNGRLSHGDPSALTGVEHAEATNPYRAHE